MFRSNIHGAGQRRQHREARPYEGAAAADAAGFARARAVARAHGGVPLRRARAHHGPGVPIPHAQPKAKNTPSGVAKMKAKNTKK